MRLLHTSDWHLGQNFMGQSRQEEHKAFLNWLLETLKKEKINALLVAGDIFDTGTPPNYALELYYNFLKELSSIKSLKTTIITAGNHDSIATLKAPKQLLEILNIKIITSGDKDEDPIISIYNDNKELEAIVCAVPFLRDGVIREFSANTTSKQKEELINNGIKAYYQNCLKKATILKGTLDIPVIGMGHLTLLGGKNSDSQREIYIGGKLDIGGNYLGDMFDYVALGHLHRNQKIDLDHVQYSGSPIKLSFSEANDTKKVNIILFENSKAIVSKIDIPQTKKLIVLKGDEKSIIKQLEMITDKDSFIEVHLNDDNPALANQTIREYASQEDLIILAVKVIKTDENTSVKIQNAQSLDELSVQDVFQERLLQDNIEDIKLKEQLTLAFNQLYSKVQEDL